MTFTKIFTIISMLILSSCEVLQQAVNQLPNVPLSNDDIASGLRQVLDKGIDKQVTKLTLKYGFFKMT